MPRRIKTRRRPTKGGARRAKTAVVRRKRQRGKGFWSNLKRFGNKANSFLKRTKLISRGAKVADFFNVPLVGSIGKELEQRGYGKRKKRTVRRRRRRGAGVSIPGGALYGKGVKVPGGGVRLAGRKRHTGCGVYGSKKKAAISY